MILAFLCITTYSHSALNLLRTQGVALRTAILRSSCVPLHKRITRRAQHNLTTARTGNLPNRQTPSQPLAHTGAKNAQHSFETATHAPRDAQYDPNANTLTPGKYTFAPFNHFATFTQQHDTSTTYIYVGSEGPIQEDSLGKQDITAKKISIEKKEIAEYFGMLSLNLQTVLIKEILGDIYMFNDGKGSAKPHFTITQMLAQLNPVLRGYHEKCIIDLATNKPSLHLMSVSVRGQVRRALYDRSLVTNVFLYITARQSMTKSLISQAYGLIGSVSKAPARAIAGILSIT